MSNDHAKDPLARLPGYALRRAASATMADLAARLHAVELRISDASVLMLIRDRVDMTSTEIGKILDFQSANMVPLLSRLELAGHIKRVPINRKSMAIVLTDRGQELLIQVDSITARFEVELLGRIPEAHRAHFLPALHGLWP